MLSLSILVCDSFESKWAKEKQFIEKATKCSVEDLVKSKDFLKDMENTFLYLNCYCWDLPWVYSNWNYFYSSLSFGNIINEDHIKYTIGEYHHKIFNYHHKENYRDNLEVLEKKIEKSAKENENGIVKIIESNLEAKIELSNEKEGTSYSINTPNKSKKKTSYLPNKSNNNLFNWNCRNDIIFDIKEGTGNNNNKKKISFYIENHKYIYGAISTSEFNFNYVMGYHNEENLLLYLMLVKYYIRNYKPYMSFNEGKTDLIEIRNSLTTLLRENYDNEIKQNVIEI